MHPQEGRRHQAGFSLLELMVTMGIMLVVLASVSYLMKGAWSSSHANYEMTDAQQRLRTAHEFINRDMVVVGDGLTGINNIRLPLVFVQTYFSSAGAAVLDPDNDTFVTLGIITSDNNVPAGTAVPGTNPAVNVLPGTDRLTIMSVDRGFEPVSLPPGTITPSGANVSITPPDVTRFNIGEIYYITNGTEATFGTITNITGENGNAPNLIFAAGDTYSLNQPGNGGPINVVSEAGTRECALMRMTLVHYFINSNGHLVRRVFGVGGGVGFRDSLIVEHMTDLQFRYSLRLLDANGNLVQPVNALTTSEQQGAVRMVETAATAETVHGVIKGQRQQVNSTTIAGIRNMQFREALQPGPTPTP